MVNTPEKKFVGWIFLFVLSKWAHCKIWIHTTDCHFNPPQRVVKMNCLQAPAGSSSRPWPLTHCFWCCIRMSAAAPAGYRRQMRSQRKRFRAAINLHFLFRAKGTVRFLETMCYGPWRRIWSSGNPFCSFCPVCKPCTCRCVRTSTHRNPFPCVMQPVGWFRLCVRPLAYMCVCEDKYKSRPCPGCISLELTIYSCSLSFFL